jgi:hypothetical protein
LGEKHEWRKSMADNTQVNDGQTPDASGETETTQEAGSKKEAPVVSTQAPPEVSQAAVGGEASSAELTVPKTRFDGVTAELKKLRAEIEAEKAKAEEAIKAAEREQAKKDGDLQKQIDLLNADLETERAKAADAEGRAKKAKISGVRTRVAARHNLPDEFIDRLVGETEEEIETDVQKLLEAMSTPPPAPPVTRTDAQAGKNSSTPTPAMSEAEIREMAVKYGVSPAHLKTVLEKTN